MAQYLAAAVVPAVHHAVSKYKLRQSPYVHVCLLVCTAQCATTRQKLHQHSFLRRQLKRFFIHPSICLFLRMALPPSQLFGVNVDDPGMGGGPLLHLGLVSWKLWVTLWTTAVLILLCYSVLFRVRALVWIFCSAAGWFSEVGNFPSQVVVLSDLVWDSEVNIVAANGFECCSLFSFWTPMALFMQLSCHAITVVNQSLPKLLYNLKMLYE